MTPLALRPPSAAQLLVILAWAYVVLPRLVQSLTAPKYRVVLGGEAPASPLAGLSRLALLAALAGWCLVVVLRRLDRLPTQGRAVLAVLLAPWLYLVVRDLYLGSLPDRPALLYPLVVVAVWVLRPGASDLAVLAPLTGLTAVLSLAMGALLPDKGVYRAVTGDLIAPDKQILPWGILVGPFTNGNNLAQFLVLGLPAVLLLRRRAHAVPVVIVTAAALVWTASRSSLAALVAGALVAAALALLPSARALVAAACLAVAGTLVTALPLLVDDDTALTNRGYIWRISLQAWAERPLLGHGSRWYDLVGEYAGELGSTAFHGHNQAVHVLVTGGVTAAVLTGLLAVAVGAAAVRAAARGALFPAVLATALLVSCVLEVSFGVVDREFLLPVTVLPLAAALVGGPTVPTRALPQPRPGVPAGVTS